MAAKNLKKIAVLGWGNFGTAMAQVATHNPNNHAVLWERDDKIAKEINTRKINPKVFSEFPLNPTISATTDLGEALDQASLVVGCLPAQIIPKILEENKNLLPKDAPFVACSKGMIVSKKKFLSQVVDDVFGDELKFCVLGGPSFADEMMIKNPTLVVIASKNQEVAKTAQSLLASRYFRSYTQQDVLGVEVAGSLKNVLAIGAGLIEGFGYGINTKAAYIARGIKEIQRFAQIYDSDPRTFFGLAGIGDLMLTGFGNQSRNRTFGARVANGEKIEDVVNSIGAVVEGLPTLNVIMDVIKENNMDMPIITTIYNVLYGKMTKKEAVKYLMMREAEPEWFDINHK